MGKDATVTSLTQENRRLQEESKLYARRSSQLKQECREKRISYASLQKQVSIVCTFTYMYVCHVHNMGMVILLHTSLVCMYVYVKFGLGQCTCSHLPDFRGIAYI